MKSSNKSSIFTGTILLLLAAFFTISLAILPLDFGVGGPGHNNILYIIGNMLYSVYGYCSLLIPLFLFIAGISCFATKWTSQKTMRLLTALIPFFTAVLTEKICRYILAIGVNNSTTIKIIITIVTGFMLIIIEILGAGIIAESVNQRIFYRNGKPRPKVDDYDDSFENYEPKKAKVDDVDDKEEASFKYNPIKKTSAFDKALSELSANKFNSEKAEKPEEKVFDDDLASEEVEDEVISEEDEPLEERDFSDDIADEKQEDKSSDSGLSENLSEIDGLEDEEKAALEELKENKNTDNSYEDLVSQADNLYEVQEEEKEKEITKDLPTMEDYEKSGEDSSTTAEVKEAEETEPANPASIITQEEYAALINPEPETNESENEPDELEWPDLPPVPETLPPDYIDENDPIFDFPPKEESEKVEELEESDEDFLPEVDLTSELPAKKNDEDELSIKSDTLEKENPYSAARYIDSKLHPNPAYSYGITLRDNVEEEEKPVEKKVRPAAPKYPTKISLDENVTVPEVTPVNKSEQQKPLITETLAPNPEDDVSDDLLDDEYVEDETLPEPDYLNMKEPSLDGTEGTEKIEDTTLDEDFFDIDMNEQEDDEELSDDIEPVTENPDSQKNQTEKNDIFNQIKSQEKVSFTASVSDVFSDMDADVRKEKGIEDPSAPETNAAEDEIDLSTKSDAKQPAEEKVLEEKVLEEKVLEEKELDPNANSAKNLTADELTDFFNAQQAENTPVTKEIEGNLPTTNRASIKGPYVIPSDLLTAYKDDQYWIIDDKTKEASIQLKQTLAEFNIDADIIGIKKGPVVTMFELLPAPGVKLSKIVALQDNIALSLAASSVRIVAPIPGKQAVGIEVPNKERSIVSFREIIEMNLPEYSKMAVPVVLGKDILGKAQLIDLVKTPHMLIAGATGSGKSVCVNSLILSILYKRSYKDVKLILVDPKVVELKLYNNIPHLLTPVITEPKRALQALQYCLCEMERRYALLDGLGVRDIASYNQRIKERDICTEKLPYIVVIIDEFADLMATSGKELESIVARLTAMSRAVGIHLVLATQRPSVNVITGLIKANIPSRIAFMVASRTDSNIIIDSVGAEKLLGRGDMLYASAVDPYPVRIQGTFVSDSEVENVVEYVKRFGEPEYIDEEIFVDDDDGGSGEDDLFGNAIGEDPLYDQALEIVVQAGKASASYIQRRLKIGYNRAARLVEEMEERGIVGPANGSKPREVIHIP